eukprot:6756945-Pyramimonas_sp.AAC.1
MASISLDTFGQAAAEEWLKTAIQSGGPLSEAFTKAVQDTVQRLLGDPGPAPSVAVGAASNAAEFKTSTQDDTIKSL